MSNTFQDYIQDAKILHGYDSHSQIGFSSLIDDDISGYNERSVDYYKTGNVGDFLGSAFGGAAEGYTFGAVRLGKRDYNKMNLAQRMGRGFGSALSYISPKGPFALLGKGINKATGRFAAKSSQNIIKGIKADNVAKHIGKTDKAFLEKTIQKELFKNPTVAQTLNRYGFSDKQMETVERMMINNMDAGLRASFKNAGRTIDPNISRNIANNLAKELRKPGRHVNNFEDWVEQGLARSAPFLKGLPAKYMGMAAQDVAVFAGHQLITTSVGNALYGDKISGNAIAEQFGINAVQAALFPGVRFFGNIPGLGSKGATQLSQGFEIMKNKAALRKGLDRFNYAKMAGKPNGEKNVRGLLHLMTRGADNNIINVSRFQGQNWKIRTGKNAGKTYSPNEILQQADSMPIDDVIDLLEQYKLFTVNKFGQFGKEYIKDLIGSGPRMLAGSMVMNIDLWVNNKFEDLTYPELAQHMMIGAFMTKSRGLWDRDTEPSQWAKDFQNYQEAFSYLNLDSKNLESFIDVYSSNRRIGDLMNLTTRQTPIGNAIYDIIKPNDIILNSTVKDDNRTFESLDHTVVQKVSEAVNLANQMHRAEVANPYKVQDINARDLPVARIEQIYNELSNLRIGDTKLTEIPIGDLLNNTMRELGESNKNYYFRMIQIIQDKIPNLNINVAKDGKIHYDIVNLPGNIDFTVDGNYNHSINKFYKLLEMFSDLGYATSKIGDKSIIFQEIGSGNNKKIVIKGDESKVDVAKTIDDIAETTISQIVKNIHGNNSALRIDNFFGTVNNPYLQATVAGKMYENMDMAYKLANSKGGEEGLTALEQNFVELAHKMFTINSRYTKQSGQGDDTGTMIKNAPEVIPSDEVKFSNLEGDKLLRKENDLAELQTKINTLFDFMSAGNLEKKASPEYKNKITESEADLLIKEYSKLNYIIPKNLFEGLDFNTNLADYVLKRTLQSEKFTEEDLAIVTAAKDAGVFDLKDKSLITPDALRLHLIEKGYSQGPGGEVDKSIQKYTKVFNKISKHPAIKPSGEIPADNIALSDIKNIDFLYEMTNIGNFNKIMDSLSNIRETIVNDQKYKDVRDIGGGIIDIVNTFMESAGRLADQGITKNSDILNEFNNSVEVFLNRLRTKVAGHNGLNGLEKQISELQISLDIVRDAYKKNQFMSVDASPVIQDIGDIIENIVKFDTYQDLRTRKLISSIMSLGNDFSTRGMFLRKADTLQKELARVMGVTEYNKFSLTELINDYKKTRSSYDLNRIIDNINIQSMSKVNITKYNNDLTESIRNVKELVNKNASHNDNNSPMKLIKKFNLTDINNPNKIDQEAVELIVNTLVEIPDGDIQTYINSKYSVEKQNEFKRDDLPENEKTAIIDDIRQQKVLALEAYVQNKLLSKNGNDAVNLRKDLEDFALQLPNLVRYVSSLDEPITTFTVKDNSIVVEDNVPGRRTLAGINSPLMKMIGLDVIQINQMAENNSRKTTINAANFTKRDLENMLAERVHVDPTLAEKIFTSETLDIEDVITDAIKNQQSERLFTVLDMTNGAPIAVPLTKENIDRVNDFYARWRENKLIQLELKDKRLQMNFDYATQDIGNSSADVAIKMLQMNLDISLANKFDNFFTDDVYKSNNRDALFDEMAQKLLKVTNQTINKNYDYINDNYLDLITRYNGVSQETKNLFNTFKNKKLKVLVVSDQAWEKDFNSGVFTKTDLMSNRDAVVAKLDQSDSPYADKFKAKIMDGKKIESLHSSVIDGAVTIVNNDLRKVLGSTFGNENGNGIKANTAFADGFMTESAQGLVIKGYFHYNDAISKIPNLDDVDMIVGESAAKAFYGLDANEKPLSAFKLNPGSSFVDNLLTRSSGNRDGIIEIPFSSIGLGHMAKQGDKVMVSNSLNDFLAADIVKDIRKYKGLDKTIDELVARKIDFDKLDDPQLILTMMREMEDDTGYDFSDGSYGFAQELLNAGMSTNNTAIKNQLKTLFRGKIFDSVRRNMTSKGADTYLIPDLFNDHNPTIFAELENFSKDITETESVVNSRIATNFGDVSLPKHLGKRNVSSIEDLDFIIQHEGRDVRIRFVKNDIDVTDAMFDVVNDKTYRTTFDGNNLKINSIRSDKALMKDLQELRKYVEETLTSTRINKTVATFEGIHNLITQNSHNRIVKDNQGFPVIENVVSKSLDNLKNKYKINLGVVSIAIPKKSLDVGFNRIRSFLTEDMGNHTIINNYDLRVMHQRDFDGDHGFHYLGMPSRFINESIKKLGTIEDYRQLPRYAFNNNIFGMNQDGKFGKIPQDIGFSTLKNQINRNEYAIGETISLKNTLNWASNIGIEFNFKDNSKAKFVNVSDIDMIKKGLESFESLSARAQADINQNAVDKHFQTDLTNVLRRATIFGDVNPQIKEKLSKLGIEIPGSIEGAYKKFKTDDPNTINSGLLNQEIANIMLGTLNKAKSVFNDPFNEGGQFTPTDYYLGEIYDNLLDMLRNPNQYVADELIKRFSNKPDMMQEIIKTFYTEGRTAEPILDASKIQDYFSGRPPRVINKLITLKNAGNITKSGYDNPIKALTLADEGYALQKIREKELLKDVDFYGQLNSKQFKIDLATVRARKTNFMNSIAIYKTFYPNSDPVKTLFSDQEAPDVLDFAVLDAKETNNKFSFQNVNMRSAVYHLLTKEASSLSVEIGKMDGSQYKVNEYDYDILSSRLRDVESALQILDKLAMKNLLNDKKGTVRVYKNNINNFVKKVRQPVNVYSFSGRIDVADIMNQDFSQLTYHGNFNPKASDSYKMRSNRTYIELTKPLIEKFLGPNEVVQNQALWLAIDNVKNIDNIVKTDRQIDRLYDDVANVMDKINDNYQFARKHSKENIQEKSDAYAYSGLNDQIVITELFKKYNSFDKDGNLRLGENDPTIDLALLLLNPRPLSGSFVKGPMTDLPYVYSSPRLQSAVYKFLSDNNVLKPNNMPEKLEYIIGEQRRQADIMNGLSHEDAYLHHLTDVYFKASSDNVDDLFRDSDLDFSKSLFADYGYFDPAFANVYNSRNYSDGVYSKATTKGKKIRYFRSKRKENNSGCK